MLAIRRQPIVDSVQEIWKTDPTGWKEIEVAMNLLGISCSARIWGNCESSVKTVLVSAAERGATCKFVRLTDLRLDACRGCFRCVREGFCPIDDDLKCLLDLVSRCDAMVLAAPVYFMVAPSQLIRLLDRLLVMSNSCLPLRPAITITIMGNSKWRGVSEPIVNMTASLLRFEVIASLAQVAEGPGEVLLDIEGVEQLSRLGKLIVEKCHEISERLRNDEQMGSCARRSEIIFENRGGVCTFCRSDFFRIEGKMVICPICGNVGDLVWLSESGEFRSMECQPRWGIEWLKSHIASWIKPSIKRYRLVAPRALAEVKDLRRRSEKMVEDIKVSGS